MSETPKRELEKRPADPPANCSTKEEATAFEAGCLVSLALCVWGILMFVLGRWTA